MCTQHNLSQPQKMILPFAATGVNVEDTGLREISQGQRDKSILSYLYVESLTSQSTEQNGGYNDLGQKQ